MLCVVTEVTDRVIGERRLRVLRDLAARTVGVEGVEDSCRRLCEVLAQYPLDTPFAALYLIDAGRQQARCVARSGDLPAHTIARRACGLTHSLWPLAELIDSETVQELDRCPRSASTSRPDPGPIWCSGHCCCRSRVRDSRDWRDF
jgi:hypothetical protein